MSSIGAALRRTKPAVDILKQIKGNKGALLGLSVVVFYFVIAVIAPQIAPHSPIKIDMAHVREPPSLQHLLGTDELGRDILSRILHGDRLAFFVGLISVGLAVVIGVPLGLIAGYRGGLAGELIMRGMDLLLSFPYILLSIAIVATLGPGLENAMIALGIWLVPTYARLVRGMTLSVREEQYVEAGVMSGESEASILTRYVLPNCLSPLIVQATLDFPKAILASAALSFLGLGAQPPTPEWGVMITRGRLYLEAHPHMALFPGLALFFLVVGFNFLGDAIRDIMDPRLRGRR